MAQALRSSSYDGHASWDRSTIPINTHRAPTPVATPSFSGLKCEQALNPAPPTMPCCYAAHQEGYEAGRAAGLAEARLPDLPDEPTVARHGPREGVLLNTARISGSGAGPANHVYDIDEHNIPLCASCGGVLDTEHWVKDCPANQRLRCSYCLGLGHKYTNCRALRWELRMCRKDHKWFEFETNRACRDPANTDWSKRLQLPFPDGLHRKGLGGGSWCIDRRLHDPL